MMRSLYSAISGLKNHQTKMDVIGNNIANVNTSGFKRSRTDFSTMLSQTIKGASSPGQNQGGTNAVQVGMGSMLGSTSQIMSQGSSQTTGQVTDLMLQGSGYFVLQNGAETVYTRAGGFSFDSEGNLEDPASGALVQGYTWPADDTIDPSWAGTGYGNIKFKLGDQLILDNDLVNKLKNMDTAMFTGAVVGNQVWDKYPSYTDSAFVGASQLQINVGGTPYTAMPTPPVTEYSFDAVTGELRFPEGFDPTAAAVTVTPMFAFPLTFSTPGYTSTTELTNASLDGAANILILSNGAAMIDVSPAIPANSMEFSYSDADDTITFGPGVDATNTEIYFIPPAPMPQNHTFAGEYTVIDPTLKGAIISSVKDNLGLDVDPSLYSFDRIAGIFTFDPSISDTNSYSISYDEATPLLVDSVSGWDGQTSYTSPDLQGASGLVISGMSENNPPTASDEYHFDSATGTITFGPGFDPSGETFEYISGSSTNVTSVDPAPYTFTDPDNLVGAGNLRIEGMTEVPLGQTPESGEYRFDPTTGTITFATGYNPATSNVELTYAEALPLTGADGNVKTFVVDYLPTPGTPVYVDGTKYTLGTAGALDGTKEEYSIDVVQGKYQITLSKAPSNAAHKIGFDFVEQPHTLSSFSIDQTGVYSDGVSSLTRKIAQVAVAKFPNDQGLQNMGGNFYLESNNSGKVDVGAAGQNGRASIIPSALEMSNVDLAQEFTDMIVTQRGFQANSRVITVSDSLLQELIDLKRN